jgi:bacillithiol biosynthesis cysteine-adding enzyme BshC
MPNDAPQNRPVSRMTELTVRTEPIGGSPLARAAIDGALGEWYVPRPASVDGWRLRAETVRKSFEGRTWLDALRPAFGATGAAAARLERVVNGRGIVVTTGQQPGLFGGPVYTWSTALSALTLADEIEAATGIPTAPVFWAANDDADFAEACWTAVAVPGGAERLSVAAGAELGRTMADMPLGDVAAALDTLTRAAGATIDDRPIAAARNAYRPGATVGGAYLAFLREVFEPLGIPVLDAAHAAVAQATRPQLVRALDRAAVVADALHERDKAIAARGFTPQVAEVAGLSLVFERRANGEKRRIPITEAGAIAVAGAPDGTRILSPNVLLRPVIERAMLPTVAYVAGPGEFSYFAQVSAVAAALGLEAPMAVPRWSTTIVEPHIARILSRLGVEEAELAHPHAPEGRLARAAVPTRVTDALSSFRSEVARSASDLVAALREGELPIPSEVVDGLRRAIGHRLDRVERRVVAAAKRRDQEAMMQIATARGALFPLGKRQERALNIIPFLARHGTLVTRLMADAARAHARVLVGTFAVTEGQADQRSVGERSRAGSATPTMNPVEPTPAADA